MYYNSRWMVMGLIFAGLYLMSCREKPDRQTKIESPGIEYSGGDTLLYRVRLTPKAAARYNIQTSLVRELRMAGSTNETLQKVMPRDAVIYGQNGDAWVFINPESLLFLRERITIDSIDGDLVVFSQGPPVGTEVVTSGAEQLFSAQ